jgi:O-antigen/teichoic acid export membrane protein
MLVITVVQTSMTVALWVGAWALLVNTDSLFLVVTLGIVLTLVAAVTTLWWVRHLIAWRSSWRPRAALLMQDGRFALGMFAAQAAGALVYQGDRLLVAALGTTAMAGLYALSVNITNKTAAAAAAINSFVVPRAASLQSVGSFSATVSLVHSLNRAVAALVVPTLVPALMLAEAFLVLWLGEFASQELAIAFRILIIAFALPAFAMPVSNVLIANGYSGLSARFAWLAVATLFLSMLIFVPQLELIGAAIAMLLANATSLLFAWAAARVLKVPPSPGRARFWAGLALGCAVQAVILIALAPKATSWVMLLLIGAIAWAVPFGVRAIVNSLSLEERQLLRRVIHMYKGF